MLGNSIVPEDQVYYVKTPVQVKNFAGYHDVKYMFASLEQDPRTGEYVTVFGGTKNDYVPGRGDLGSYAAALSCFLMQMPPEQRDGCAATLMQLMELGGERSIALGGDLDGCSQLPEGFRGRRGLGTAVGAAAPAKLQRGVAARPVFENLMRVVSEVCTM